MPEGGKRHKNTTGIRDNTEEELRGSSDRLEISTIKLRMVLNSLHVVLWLVSAITLTTQDLVKLSVSPVVTVACGESVTLHCNVSSSQDGLVIKHLAWIHSFEHNHNSLCHVNSFGDATENPLNTISDFRCNYTHERLALTMHEILPLEEGTYVCKLRSNKGVKEAFTTVKLQECYREAYVNASSEGVTCTFKGVHPAGEVHWFHGSTNLTGGTLRTINSARLEWAWPAITSTLLIGESNSQLQGPYNCSLWNPRSGRYITSRRVQIPSVHPGRGPQASDGAGAQGPLSTIWGFLLWSFLSAFLMKE